MIDFPISTLIQVAKDIYVILNKDNNPDGLSGDTLKFFQRFKKAYESRNLEEIGKLISNSYSGNFFNSSTREELLKTFDIIFKNAPNLCQLKLIINIYKLSENTSEACKGVVEFDVKLNLFLVPISSWDAGKLYIEFHSEPPYGLYKITRLEKIQE